MLLNTLKLPSLLIANEIQFAGRLLPHQNEVQARVPVARTLITTFFETARPELAYSVPSYEPPFFGVAPAASVVVGLATFSVVPLALGLGGVGPPKRAIKPIATVDDTAEALGFLVEAVEPPSAMPSTDFTL